MKIKNDGCRLIPFRLTTIRAFIFDQVVLDDHFETDVDLQDIDEFLYDAQDRIENEQNSQINKQHLSFVTGGTEVNQENDTTKLPLIRLRVDHTGFNKIRSTQFGQKLRIIIIRRMMKRWNVHKCFRISQFLY